MAKKINEGYKIKKTEVDDINAKLARKGIKKRVKTGDDHIQVMRKMVKEVNPTLLTDTVLNKLKNEKRT